MKKTAFLLSAVAALALGFTSCNSNNDPSDENTLMSFDFTFDTDTYTPDGYWKDVYDPAQTYFTVAPGANFSHKAEVTTFDGIEYKSFTGFCPSIVNDNSDHTGADWTKYQFGAATKTDGIGYLIAHWDVRETQSTPLAERSCLIECFGYTFRPLSINICNTAYTYWAMINGTAFSHPFGPDDYLILDIYGVNKGISTLAKSVYLAENGQYIDKWQQIDLTSLGEVQQIYFMMRSSDSGEYGMNVPAYFAMDRLQFLLPTYQNF